MNLFSSIFNWGLRARLEGIAAEVAQETRASVWREVQHRIGKLPHNEARGYIRVRAGAIIRQAVEEKIAVKGESDLRLNEITEMAFKAAIRLALTERRTVRVEAQTSKAA